MECKVWSVKCGVESVECKGWNVWNVKWSGECGVWSVKWRVWSVECKVWNVRNVWSVKCGV